MYERGWWFTGHRCTDLNAGIKSIWRPLLRLAVSGQVDTPAKGLAAAETVRLLELLRAAEGLLVTRRQQVCNHRYHDL